MEMAFPGELHEGSGEGRYRREPKDEGGGAGMGRAVFSPNRTALNGMGEFLLTQVRCLGVIVFVFFFVLVSLLVFHTV